MNAKTASPITATKATEIRTGFAAKAEALRPQVAALRAAGNDTMADMLAKQIASWDFMAARQYEAMTVARTI